jgi:hypothetical protein
MGLVIRHPLGAWMCGRKYIFIRNLGDRQSSGKEHGDLVSHCSQFFGFHYTITSFLQLVQVNFCPFILGLTIQFIPGIQLTHTYFVYNNQLDASNIQNLFCHKTLHVSGIFCAHHQELSAVHSAIGTFHAGYVTAC